MSDLVEWLDKTLYPEYADNWDDERLRRLILGRLEPHMSVLDLGAGAGRIKQMNFRGLVARVTGIDPDPRVHHNPLLDEAHEGVAENLPFADDSFDLVFADNVLEHLADPEAVLRQVWRVLRPGGLFIAKTPNRTHYMPTIARLTPTVFHRFVNRLRGRASVDTFPTQYRINSTSAVRRYAKRTGFEVVSIELVEGRPEYLRFNAFTYLVGWIYERIVNATALLKCFRVVLFVELRKSTLP